MTRIRGFKLGKRLIRISKWIFRKTSLRSGRGYHRLNPVSPPSKTKPISKLMKWISTGAASLCSSIPSSGYVPLRGVDQVTEKKAAVPKGHLAVYVGGTDGDFHRVLVPIVYFNHPLFGELLREAEEEYGYHQQGGITIPCGYTEFERVQTRIKAGSGSRRLSWKPRWSRRRC